MYIERDKEFDLLYISFRDTFEAGEVVETKELIPGAYGDFDSEGNLIGIEIVNSKNVLGISAADLDLSGELLGVKEAAKLAGKDRANFLRDLASQPDFPKPVARVASGQLWLSKDVERYMRERDKQQTKNQAADPEGPVDEDTDPRRGDYEYDQYKHPQDSSEGFYPNCAEDRPQKFEEGYGSQSA